MDCKTDAELKEFGFYVCNPPWNKKGQYLEFYANFVNPKRIWLDKFFGFDSTQGRWEKVLPIINKYEKGCGIRCDSAGFDGPQHIVVPAEDRETAIKILKNMFYEMT